MLDGFNMFVSVCYAFVFVEIKEGDLLRTRSPSVVNNAYATAFKLRTAVLSSEHLYQCYS